MTSPTNDYGTPVKRPKKSIHGSCTVDEYGYCDECGEQWPMDEEAESAP